MKLIWHIIRKDIARDRWALLLWAALFAAQVAIGLVMLHDDGIGRSRIMNLQSASLGLVFTQFLFGYVLVARLVHADMVLGTDMFWVTRPISRVRLLMAKAGAIMLMFGLLPVFLRLPWWLWCGFTSHDLFWTAVDTLGWQLLMIGPAFLIASLTNELGRVLLWTLLLFIGAMLWVALLGSVFKADRYPDEATLFFRGVVYTRLWFSALLAVVFSAAIVAHQYLTRQLVRSIGLTIGAVGVVAAVGLFGRMNWSEALAGLPRPAATPAMRDALTAVKAEVGVGMPIHEPGTPADRVSRSSVPEVTIATEVYFQGLPESLTVSTGSGQQTWRWPGGLSVARPGRGIAGYLQSERLLRRTYSLPEKDAEDGETVAWFEEKRKQAAAKIAALQEARGSPRSQRWRHVPPSRPGMHSLIYTVVPEAFPQRAIQESPAYETVLKYTAIEPVLTAELPIQVGARGGSRSIQARLQWIRPDEKDLVVGIMVTAPMLRRHGLWLIWELVRDTRENARGEIWTVNRATADLDRNGGFSLQAATSAVVAGVLLNWNQPRVRPRQIIRNGASVLHDPQWTEHTSLVLVSEQTVGRFTVNLKTDRLEFLPRQWVEEPPTVQKD